MNRNDISDSIVLVFLVGVGICMALALMIMLAGVLTLPFAFVGWAILMVGNLILTVPLEVSYWVSVAVGVVLSLFLSLVSTISYKTHG